MSLLTITAHYMCSSQQIYDNYAGQPVMNPSKHPPIDRRQTRSIASFNDKSLWNWAKRNGKENVAD